MMMIEMIRPLDVFQVGLRLRVASIATFHFAVGECGFVSATRCEHDVVKKMEQENNLQYEFSVPITN